MPQTRLTPIEVKTPRQEIDPDQIDSAIQRGVAADKGSRAESNRNGRAFRPAPQVITRRASDIKPEPISWLWKYWLARGKLHIIAGVPETGKTTIALSYAAIVSSGGEWPDGTRAIVGSVLIWTAEDDARDTLVPRLMRMGADLDRIHFIEEAIPAGAKSRPFNPATDMPALVEKAKAIGDVALLILDPVVAAMPMTRNKPSAWTKTTRLRKAPKPNNSWKRRWKRASGRLARSLPRQKLPGFRNAPCRERQRK